jgi:prolyl oligopeptidase PreP (S9A serine peptidase family)
LALQPELFGALIFNVGQPDEIRGARLDPTAARNLAEMGDTSSAAGVELLRRLSPYHRVPTAVRLPAMLIKSGDDDYNFSSVTAAGKYVARLQAANTGDRPIVWMNLPGGHTDLFGDDFEVAAQAMAFLFWQTGHPGYQPTAMP